MKYRKKAIVSILSIALVICALLSNLYVVTISKAADYGLSNPRVEDGITTWDCIYFGDYWQSEYDPINEPENPLKYYESGQEESYKDEEGTQFVYCNSKYFRKEPIKWRVLSVNDNEAFLLSDKNISYRPYNEQVKLQMRWEISELRAWLNETFYEIAFSETEKDSIKIVLVENDDIDQTTSIDTGEKNSTNDKIYTLSFTEIMNPIYGFNEGYGVSETRMVSNTSYSENINSGTSNLNKTWLRTHGSSPLGFMYVDSNGGISTIGSGSYGCYSIRPCMHIDLSKATWTKADSVSAEVGEVVPIPTSTPTPTHTPTSSPTPEPTQTPNPKVTATPETPKTVTAPSKVKKLSVKNKKGKKAVLSWKKVKDAKGYQIQYATDVAFSKKKTKSTKKTKITIKKLKSKKAYSFRVCAYVLDGKKKLYGKWSKVKKVKIKK